VFEPSGNPGIQMENDARGSRLPHSGMNIVEVDDEA